MRGENAGLYAPAGLCRVRAALRPGGVAVFWSPERYPAFEGDLRDVFDDVRDGGGRRRDRRTAARVHDVRRRRAADGD